MSFLNLGLSDRLVQGLLATGYTTPTPIQQRAIPMALEGKDITGCAQTGTGKTAAFVLPILQRLTSNGHSRSDRHVKALILTPTRELAQQVEESVRTYAKFTSVSCLSVFGGVNMDNQLRRLRRGVDIVIATPGRLLDHMNRRSIDLSHIEVLVLDEADRMLDMGFINDVRKIVAKVPRQRQTLLFSATISNDIKRLVATVQQNPESIQIGEQRPPVETIRQHFYTVPQETKMDLLLHILNTSAMESALVFTRTKHGADKISRRLEKRGVKAVALHSNRTQAQRDRALAGFKEGRYSVLVATDIAARGIDVDGISHVVNFEIPRFAEDYVHRVGRTGRGTATGDAITFVSPGDWKYLKSIERFVGMRNTPRLYPGFETITPSSGNARNPEPAIATQERPIRRQESSSDERSRSPKRRTRRPDAGHNFARRPRKQQRPQRVESPVVTVEAKPDWRKLIAEEEEQRGGLRKKFKRFFKRA